MMHSWCTHDALMMHSWCTDDALMMHWWCTDDAQMMHRWYTDDAVLMRPWCGLDAVLGLGRVIILWSFVHKIVFFSDGYPYINSIFKRNHQNSLFRMFGLHVRNHPRVWCFSRGTANLLYSWPTLTSSDAGKAWQQTNYLLFVKKSYSTSFCQASLSALDLSLNIGRQPRTVSSFSSSALWDSLWAIFT